MGRPLNKRNFGTGAGNQIKVRAKIGNNSEGDGYVVRQRGTNRYQVKVGSNTGTCTVADKTNGSLLAGEMTISVVDSSGVIKRVKNVKSHRLLTYAGEFVRWAFASALGTRVRMGEEGQTLVPVITISTQPTSQTVTHPAAATFSVSGAVTNGATLSYQWTKNATNISGATAASYTTPATVVGDSGAAFACKVSGSDGAMTVTSNNATLTVN